MEKWQGKEQGHRTAERRAEETIGELHFILIIILIISPRIFYSTDHFHDSVVGKRKNQLSSRTTFLNFPFSFINIYVLHNKPQEIIL